jgi:hypothetical protein
VQKEGFTPVEHPVELRTFQETKAEFKLVALNAALVIHHAPPGADVLIDGNHAGAARADGEFSATNPQPGKHSVQVRHEQFKSLQTDQVFVPGKTVDVEGSLESLMGTLRIDVSPADARVRIRPEGEALDREVILLLGVLVYGFSQGFRNRVVLFYDTKDALIACVCVVGCFLAVFWAPLWVLVAVTALWTARNAIHYNRNVFVGSAIAVFKVTFGFAGIASFFNQLGCASDSKRKSFDRVISLAVAGLLVWVFARMINGEEVYAARGWTLQNNPEPESGPILPSVLIRDSNDSILGRQHLDAVNHTILVLAICMFISKRLIISGLLKSSGEFPQVKQRVFHGPETLAKLLILNGLLKLAETAISVSGSVALGHQ